MGRGRIGALVRSLGAALAALTLASCAGLPQAQDPDQLLLRLGPERRYIDAAPHADLFLDYALLSDQAYANSLYEDPAKPFDVGPDTYCRGRVRAGAPCTDVAGLTAYARGGLAGWRRIYARMDVAAFPCRPERPNCSAPLPGLGVQVWMKKGPVCPEAAIVFRGTDGQSADDWLSNLRWLLRLLPLYDQYDQVQDHTPDFVRAIERQPCFARGLTRITAVGHSLGGGLAQQAAYQDGRVRAVRTFDPSVVTGFYDVDPERRAQTVQGLGIDRVYEAGEILALPRFLMRQFVPVSTCDPLIREVRLATVRGNPIEQHSLASMATGLLAWSKARRQAGLSASLPLPGPGPLSCRAAA